jgi:PKD repeat protein
MTPSRVPLALVLVIAAVLLAAGCTEKNPDTVCNTENGTMDKITQSPIYFYNLTDSLKPVNHSFMDNSTGGPTTWLWDFGDGSMSSLRNPVHIYSHCGRYNVSLMASNQYGSGFFTKEIFVYSKKNSTLPFFRQLLHYQSINVSSSSGCEGQNNKLNNSKDRSANTTSSTGTTQISQADAMSDYFQILKLYHKNMTSYRKKLPDSLLVIADPDCPKGMWTPEWVYSDLRVSHYLIPANKAIARFNLTKSTGQVIGDQIILTIHVYPNTSTHFLDSVVTNITWRKENYHLVEAWVDMNNLDKLAALEGVQNISIPLYPSHSGEHIVRTASAINKTSDWIQIYPLEDHFVGDVIEINGTTNLDVNAKVRIEFSEPRPLSMAPGSYTKPDEFEISQSLGYVKIQKGIGGINRWSYTVNTTGYHAPQYYDVNIREESDHSVKDYTDIVLMVV